MKKYLIYGYHSIRLALQQPERINQLYLAKSLSPKLQTLFEIAQEKSVPTQLIETSALNKKAEDERHQGCLAEMRSVTWGLDTIKDLLKIHQNNLLLLIIDGLEDPRNLGACLRTANAMGVHAIIASEKKVVKRTPVARKTSSGASEITPYIIVKNMSQTIEFLKENNIWILGSSLQAELAPKNIELKDRPLAVVIGKESDGISHLTHKLCDYHVKLPMYGDVESLNVSVATGILLYEIQRQRTIY